MSGTDDLVTSSVGDGIAEIRLSHPEKRNAFSVALTEEFHDEIREALLDEEVHAILLTRRGTGLLRGHRPRLTVRGTPRGPAAVHRPRNEFFEWMRNNSTPIVAAATGHAIGTAATLFLYCADLKVVAPGVEFWWPEVECGIAPVVRTVFLVNEAGSALALETMLLGERISAERAPIRAGQPGRRCGRYRGDGEDDGGTDRRSRPRARGRRGVPGRSPARLAGEGGREHVVRRLEATRARSPRGGSLILAVVGPPARRRAVRRRQPSPRLFVE